MVQNRFRWFFLGALIFVILGCAWGGGIQLTATPSVVSPLFSSTQPQPDGQVQETEALQPTQLPAAAGSPGSYQSDKFSFVVPAGWKLKEGPLATGPNAWNYMFLNLKILVTVQSKELIPLITITSRELPPGSSLEKEFNQTYATAKPEIKPLESTQTAVDGINALVKRYDRPWGEPWYHFEDTWLEKDGMIYMISYQSRPKPAAADLEIYRKMLDSLHFK